MHGEYSLLIQQKIGFRKLRPTEGLAKPGYSGVPVIYSRGFYIKPNKWGHSMATEYILSALGVSSSLVSRYYLDTLKSKKSCIP